MKVLHEFHYLPLKELTPEEMEGKIFAEGIYHAGRISKLFILTDLATAHTFCCKVDIRSKAIMLDSELLSNSVLSKHSGVANCVPLEGLFV